MTEKEKIRYYQKAGQRVMAMITGISIVKSGQERIVQNLMRRIRISDTTQMPLDGTT